MNKKTIMNATLQSTTFVIGLTQSAIFLFVIKREGSIQFYCNIVKCSKKRVRVVKKCTKPFIKMLSLGSRQLFSANIGIFCEKRIKFGRLSNLLCYAIYARLLNSVVRVSLIYLFARFLCVRGKVFIQSFTTTKMGFVLFDSL